MSLVGKFTTFQLKVLCPEFADLIELESKLSPGPWEWDGIRIREDEDCENGKSIYIPECSTLGPTAIALSTDYEFYERDCIFFARCEKSIY